MKSSTMLSSSGSSSSSIAFRDSCMRFIWFILPSYTHGWVVRHHPLTWLRKDPHPSCVGRSFVPHTWRCACLSSWYNTLYEAKNQAVPVEFRRRSHCTCTLFHLPVHDVKITNDLGGIWTNPAEVDRTHDKADKEDEGEETPKKFGHANALRSSALESRRSRIGSRSLFAHVFGRWWWWPLRVLVLVDVLMVIFILVFLIPDSLFYQGFEILSSPFRTPKKRFVGTWHGNQLLIESAHVSSILHGSSTNGGRGMRIL
jgi:hypothetical protein